MRCLLPLLAVFVWAISIPHARADAPASQPAFSAKPAPAIWVQLGLGAALALPRGERRDGGLDLGVAAGWRHGRYRLGAELRYTYLGGFDTVTRIYRASETTYRLDLGPAFAVELFSAGKASLQLGARGLFSRSGTYRRSGALLGHWECDTDGCTSDGEPSRSVPFVAFYGFSAALDLTLVLPSFFFRVSAARTRWFWGHDVEPPARAQHWLQLALGFAY